MYSPFTLNEEGTAVLHKDAVRLCQFLNRLPSDDLLYIILAYDYLNSPYRTKPPEERRRLAKSRVYAIKEKKIPEEIELIKQAIEEYKGLIFDHNRSSRDTLLNKKTMLEHQFEQETDPSKLKAYIETIDMLDKRLDEIADKISQQEKEYEVRGGGDLSLIEKWILNRESYRRLQSV